MKRRIHCLLLASGLLASYGCASPGHGTTTVQVIGPEGSPISGSYVQGGFRVPIRGVLPLTLAHDELAEFEIRKGSPDATLTLAAQHDNRGWHSDVMSQAGE